MASLGKSFAGGILLIIMGIIIIVQTIMFHFKDIFAIVGLIVLILGAYLIFSGFHTKSKLKVPKLTTKDNTKKQGFGFGDNNQNNFKKPNSGLGLSIKRSGENKLNKPKKSNKLNKSNKGNKLNKSNKRNGLNKSNKGNGLNKSNKGNGLNKSNKGNGLNKSNGSKIVSDIFSPSPQETYVNDKELVIKPTYNRPNPISRRPKKRSVPLSHVDLMDNNISNNSNIRLNASNNGSNINDNNVSKGNEILTKLQSDDTHHENLSGSALDNGNYYNQNDKGNDLNSENKDDSYVLCENKVLTTFKAFEHIAKRANKKLYIETFNLKSVSEEFLSNILSLDVKILLKSFDFKDLSYVLLLSSLIEQGAEIRISNFVNTTNLIADENYALIISNNDNENALEIGALYTDKNLVEDIKNSFDSSWAISKILEINLSQV